MRWWNRAEDRVHARLPLDVVPVLTARDDDHGVHGRSCEDRMPGAGRDRHHLVSLVQVEGSDLVPNLLEDHEPALPPEVDFRLLDVAVTRRDCPHGEAQSPDRHNIGLGRPLRIFRHQGCYFPRSRLDDLGGLGASYDHQASDMDHVLPRSCGFWPAF